MLQIELENYARQRVDFFGVADLSIASDSVEEQGGRFVAAFPRAISVGVGLMHSIVDQLPDRLDSRAVRMGYRHHGYNLVNERLDLTVSQLASMVQHAGYRALPVAASQTVDREKMVGVISHKLAAHLAGHGFIGKNCLLVTPENGPRVRWATILTDAPLAITGGLQEEQCGNCMKCVEVCPVGAFTGRSFSPDVPRSMRYEAGKCRDYLDKLEEEIGFGICGLCLFVCPYGTKASRRLAS